MMYKVTFQLDHFVLQIIFYIRTSGSPDLNLELDNERKLRISANSVSLD